MRRPSRPWLAVAAGALLCVGGGLHAPLSAQDNAPEKLRFNRDVRPLLSNTCFPCHGADAQARKAELRLDSLAGLTTPREGRTPVVAGDPGASELVRRVTSDDPKLVMPPPDSQLELSADDVATLRRWVAEGAEFEAHWAFVTPKQPPVPELEGDAWSRTDLDRFILRRLRAAGLEPQEEADRATLIRRLSLDLTGLPPAPEQVDAFIADQAPEAVERLVDRLLDSPHFGERMAQKWLDVARYADTNGFHHDNIRTAWPYRDWVIDAFNRDLPYDEFVTQQLAGDLLGGAGQSEQIATAFCRMHNINDEGGAIDAEYRVEAVADRIETVGTAFLGLTMTCARCHDHKYDPITQEDYYSLYAIFGSVEEKGVYARNFAEARAYPARIAYRTPDLEERTAAARAELATVLTELEAIQPAAEQERKAWEAQLREQRGITWLPWANDAAPHGDTPFERLDDGSVRMSGRPATEGVTFTFRTDRDDLRIVRLEALTDPSFPKGSIGLSDHGNAVVSKVTAEVLSTSDPTQRHEVTWAFAWADNEQQNNDHDVGNLLNGDPRGWALDGHQRHRSNTALLVATEPFGFAGGCEVRVTVECASRYDTHVIGRPRVSVAAAHASAEQLAADVPLLTSDWFQCGPFKGAPRTEGTSVFDALFTHDFGPETAESLDPEQSFGEQRWRHRPDVKDGQSVVLRGQQSVWYWGRSLRSAATQQVEIGLGSDDGVRAWLDGREIVADRAMRGVKPDQNKVIVTVPPGEHLLLVKIVNNGGPGGFFGRVTPLEGAPGPLDPAAWAPQGLRPADLDEQVRRAFGRRSPSFARLDKQRSGIEKRITQLDGEAVPMLVMKELPEPQQTYVLARGRYDMVDETRPVRRRPPSALGGEFPEGAPHDRLGFAQWLTRPEHPLTARVHVNRIWETLFGTGLVATSENFGMQADWPSHPELLDFLATTFVTGGWSQKALLRRLVTSAVYRQAASRSEKVARVDPANRLLAHFPRRRLDAEFVRDGALAAAGLLRTGQIGGPSVRPYQPDGLWREVSIGGNSNTQVFRRDSGDDLYRRSLYTFWKRTSPSPQMMTFDAPTREFCLVRRSATNTPLQALTLWNDEQFVEAARVLAQRVLDGAREDELRMERLFLLCTARRPDAADRLILAGALTAFRDRFQADEAAARELLQVGESVLNADLPAAEFAAWTMLANTVLNLDETLVRD